MLANKTAVITGSTSGIGLGCARAFAEKGANVVINGLGDADEIEKTRAAIEADFGVRCTYSPANMLKGDEIAGMIADTEKEFGGVDILVNNAGIQFVSPVDEFPVDKWDAIIAINLTSAFHAIRAALPGMKSRGWGRIINTASAHALVASPYKSAYVAAKHGIIGLTKVTALENATRNITCNAICPGWVRTALVEKQIAALAEKEGLETEEAARQLLAAKEPSLRFTRPEELAEAAAFLCGPGGANMTGASLAMDGGWSIQ